MSCTDCKGGTPAPLWKRCEDCAMNRLRTMMGGAPAPTVITRRYRIGDRVLVTPLGSEVSYPGKVVRCPQGRDYVVELDKGGRFYGDVARLVEEPTADSASLSSPP